MKTQFNNPLIIEFFSFLRRLLTQQQFHDQKF
jgi:hypothetical protein